MIAVSFPISLHSHASSIPILNGMNLSDWKEQVQFHLGVLDLDLALESKKLVAITSDSSVDEKSILKAWEKLNRLSLKFMRMTVANNVKSISDSSAGEKSIFKAWENSNIQSMGKIEQTES